MDPSGKNTSWDASAISSETTVAYASSDRCWTVSPSGFAWCVASPVGPPVLLGLASSVRVFGSAD